MNQGTANFCRGLRPAQKLRNYDFICRFSNKQCWLNTNFSLYFHGRLSASTTDTRLWISGQFSVKLGLNSMCTLCAVCIAWCVSIKINETHWTDSTYTYCVMRSVLWEAYSQHPRAMNTYHAVYRKGLSSVHAHGASIYFSIFLQSLQTCHGM